MLTKSVVDEYFKSQKDVERQNLESLNEVEVDCLTIIFDTAEQRAETIVEDSELIRQHASIRLEKKDISTHLGDRRYMNSARSSIKNNIISYVSHHSAMYFSEFLHKWNIYKCKDEDIVTARLLAPDWKNNIKRLAVTNKLHMKTVIQLSKNDNFDCTKEKVKDWAKKKWVRFRSDDDLSLDKDCLLYEQWRTTVEINSYYRDPYWWTPFGFLRRLNLVESKDNIQTPFLDLFYNR
jgi:hypothetical protein